ncbi:MAG: hypothetical protein HGA33_05970 [Candidatus Moranbacteria bacterium]|nr:hypothetical protein [Candidatus Moranbacteria bacterium]
MARIERSGKPERWRSNSAGIEVDSGVTMSVFTGVTIIAYRVIYLDS